LKSNTQTAEVKPFIAGVAAKLTSKMATAGRRKAGRFEVDYGGNADRQTATE
jgi:hypothetical protein